VLQSFPILIPAFQIGMKKPAKAGFSLIWVGRAAVRISILPAQRSAEFLRASDWYH
jgi:hypothetical protein